MRKLLLFSVFFILLISCQKPDCGEQYRKNNESYQNALQFVSTPEQASDIIRQYNKKNQEISKDCK